MSTELKLPTLGETAKSGTVAKILVTVGQHIANNDSVMELETDKAVVEIPSTVEGTITEILVKPGDTVAVGQTILSVDSTAAATTNGSGSKEQVQGVQKQSGAQGGISFASPAEDRPAPPPSAGTLSPAAAASPVPGPQGNQPRSVPTGTAAAGPAAQAPAPAAPSVRRIARELGVDIHSVKGSGLGGRISEADVRSCSGHSSSQPPATTSAPLPDFSRWGEVERQKLSGLRKATAHQMSVAWSTVPHVTQFDKADITQLEELRKRYSSRAEAAGGKLTLTAIAIKVLASALKVFPQFNASLDTSRDELVLKKYCHIGVAVDTDRGLLVPVLRDADRKNILEINSDLNALAERARSRKTGLDEMQGGCFTVSNLGGIGGTNFTPIVNTPEIAILGIARGSIEPVWRDGDWEPRLMLPLALSYDHRVVDGADGARFLRWVAEALEQPFLLSLQG